MTIEDVKITIKNHILNAITYRDLCVLCSIFEIPTTGRRIQVQKRLIDSILLTTNVELLHRILFMINRPSRENSNLNQVIVSQTRDETQNYIMNGNITTTEVDQSLGYQMNGYNQRNVVSALNSKLYCISNDVLDKCPINLRQEIISGVDPLNIFIPNYTKYPSGYFSAPSMAPTLINGRINIPNVQLPYCVKNTIINPSQFYCCQVVLHPLCLLIPKPTPNIAQPSRVMSKMQLQFTLSSNARHLITAHRTQINSKRFYKWQVLIRFGIFDPTKPFPNSVDSVSNLPEFIPPYLTLFVNNASVPLWDILPSNSTAKEGKRHPRPINISDYLKFSNSDEQGYRQSINVNWWQTPGVYQYYYFAIYLERKLSVNELFNRFVNKTHHIQMPISFTINFIREKFSCNNQYKKKIGDSNEIDDDDDLVISSVLPISLLCPVGKSRITCPLRGVHCQHLQCFDAHLYLMMNERRSVWKCPVCDAQATLNDLFVDEFFLKILQEFSKEEDLTEVNVNPDGSYVPVAIKESREHKQHIGNIISNVDKKTKDDIEVKPSSVSSNSEENAPVILLESDDEESNVDQIKVSPKKATNSVQSSTSVVNTNYSVETVLQKSSQSKTVIPSLTIDLTSDSEDDRENKEVVQSKSNIPLTPNTPSISPPFSHMFPHNSQTIRQQLPYPQIIPKLSSALSMNVTRGSNPLNYHQSSSSENNSYSRSQSMNKIPPFLWMSQNQRFPPPRNPNDLLNCFMPQLKSCYPPQNFANIIRQVNNYPLINSVPCTSTPLLPRPIKTDPHLNINIGFEKQCQNVSTKQPHQSTTTRHNNHTISERKTKSSLIVPSDTRNPNARRSSRILNQHKKIYREKSVSEDEEELSNSDESDIISAGRLKRRNAFDDSTSSDSSMSNRKRRRLVPDAASSDEEHSNKGNLLHQSDTMTNLKCPLVILNKLDPVVLKVYLQQNEMTKDALEKEEEEDEEEEERNDLLTTKSAFPQSPNAPSCLATESRNGEL